jgi:two-component system NtrC family sensor kinase
VLYGIPCKLNLGAKLVASFLLVIVITSGTATIIGVHLLNRAIVREAQSKVTLDLNSARQIYDQRLRDIEQTLAFTALRKFGVKRALAENNRQLLTKSLHDAMQQNRLDILAITDSTGVVVARAHNPLTYGDRRADDTMVAYSLRQRASIAGTEIVSHAWLQKESLQLAQQAQVKLTPTPRAKHISRRENEEGMMLKAAVPLCDSAGKCMGVLYGGVLLNRNYDIVDRIKSVVYENMRYKGKEVGTATIFQDGFRIATNVALASGQRAIGTIVSREVYEKVIEHGEVWTARAFVVNDWYLTAYAPIQNLSGGIIGMLYVGMLEQKYSDMKRNALLVFCGVLGVGIVLTLCVAYMLTNLIARPVRLLDRAVNALAKGDFDCTVDVGSRDEIGSLAESFNKVRRDLKHMYDRLQGKIEAADEDLKHAYRELKENQERLIQAERLASMGQLSAGVAHEINNPIGTILLYSHALLKQLPEDDERHADISMIAREADRCRSIVRDLLNFARQSRVIKEPCNMAALIEEVVTIMTPSAHEASARIMQKVEKDLPSVMLDKGQIRQMLVNLAQNSIDAVASGGRVEIHAGLLQSERTVELRVSDNGSGIAPGNLPKLFTPFFTTKGMGKGTGLGLAIAYGIVKMHGGDIQAHSAFGKGTTFIIRIPLERADQADESIAAQHATNTSKEDVYGQEETRVNCR